VSSFVQKARGMCVFKKKLCYSLLIYIYICIHKHMHIHKDIHSHIHAHTHTRAHIHTRNTLPVNHDTHKNNK
jgi:hypothetical protein